MVDKALEKFLLGIHEKFGDTIKESDVSQLLGYDYVYFRNLRTQKPLMPFLKIGAKILYLKDDVINYIKNSRKV